MDGPKISLHKVAKFIHLPPKKPSKMDSINRDSVTGIYPRPLSLLKLNDRQNRASGLCLSLRGPVVVPQPEIVQNVLIPASPDLQNRVYQCRQQISEALNIPVQSESPHGKVPFLIITGPSYVTDPDQLKGCSRWIGSLTGSGKLDIMNQINSSNNLHPLFNGRTSKDTLNPLKFLVTMRTNMSQKNERAEAGSNGKTFEIEHGIPFCRSLMCEVAEHCPIVGEISDTITPQYLSDLYSLGMISSTLVESQLHREIALGISYPIGFRTLDSEIDFQLDMYSNKVASALDSMYATSQQHQFLSVTKIGTVGIVGTIGNEDTFLTLLVNDSLNTVNLNSLIDQVCEYKALSSLGKFPRILLDVGVINQSNISVRLQTVVSLLSEHKNKIIGVIVNSGDFYVPEELRFPASKYEDTSKLHDINGCFVQYGQQEVKRNRKVDNYDDLIYADQFIRRLGDMI